MMKSVYILQFLHTTEAGQKDAKLVGVYKSAKAAEDAIDRLKDQPGFRDHPHLVNPLHHGDDQGFYLDEYEIGKDHWAEGFPMVPTREYA